MFAPISSDEGGFLAIARAWRHGATLYRDVWVDRPQGLIVTYRIYDVVVGNEDRLRIIALVFGVIGVLGVAVAVRAVATPLASVIAAFLAAVLSAAPRIEGYAANGELLSGACSAVAVALAALVVVGRRPGWWMVLAGVAGAVGWSIKQSGVDGLVATGIWLLIALAAGWMPRRTALVRLGQLCAGAAVVLGACALHAALTEWHGWWYAVIGYRAEQRSVFVGANWARLLTTAKDVWPVFVPTVAVTLVATVLPTRDRAPRQHATALLVLWLLMSVLGFLAGGQFFHHYWVGLALPLAALAGVSIGRLEASKTRLSLLCVVAVVSLGSWMSVVVLSNGQVPISVSNEPRLAQAEIAGHWLRSHHQPGDSLYAMCAAAHLYAHAEMDPVYRYLWNDGEHHAEGAQAELEGLFTGDHPPTWVAIFDRPNGCNPSGVIQGVLSDRYFQFSVVDGVRMMHLDPAG